MITLADNNVAFFDVDDTLIHWKCPAGRERDIIEIQIDENHFSAFVVPHRVHIERLKRHKVIGNAVVVWSRSGSEWAEAVVKALDLEGYVDICMSKPFYYYDDKKCCEILGEHRNCKDE
jgi:FMN phosphatase YigB (HAD superfamily)